MQPSVLYDINRNPITANPNGSLGVGLIGTRSRVGMYGAATGLVAGSAGAQNIASIENPAASGKIVYVKLVKVSAAAGTTASNVFQYAFGRTTATPSAGTTLTAQKHDSNDASPVAIVRSGPTATAAAGALWAGIGPIFQAAGSLNVPEKIAWDSRRDDENIVLAAGEGLLLSAGANDTDWSHSVSFSWEEV